MITIDGAAGEGGGQIVRTALSLSVCRGQPLRIDAIRARREKPGLRPQHLAAVRAAAEVCGARVEGASLGASWLQFAPGPPRAGSYRFAIGTAGSAILVLQTVLPALLTADGPSEIVLEGGTHNPRAPTFEFLARAYLPLVERMGPRVRAQLERAGFEPAGGGRLRVSVVPVRLLAPLHLDARGALQHVAAEVLISKLPAHIAEREAAELAAVLGLDRSAIDVRTVHDSRGPGNVVTVATVCEHVTNVFAGFGRRGVPAETVARGVGEEARRYLEAQAPVGPHLADQLLLPIALAGAGSFVTTAPSSHTLTNIGVIRRFLPVRIECAESGSGLWRVEVSPDGS
jgi:RNA 3'-terminal phosphate cyclase (ATP)